MINFILPIHKADKTLKEKFVNCIESLKKQTVTDFTLTVVYKPTTETKKLVESTDYGVLSHNLIENNGNTDFCSQINLGVSQSNSEYVSIIEADDEVTQTYVSNAVAHINAYPEIDTFLPIVVDTNDKGEFISFTNESVWAMNLTEEIGYLDHESLKNYENYQTSGMIIKTKTFNDIGGFKPSIKLSFGYEFLLRLTHQNKIIYVIPKLTYKHTNFREGSLFWDYKNGKNSLSEDEAKFWIETAKKEYFFNEDREISFETAG